MIYIMLINNDLCKHYSEPDTVLDLIFN